jgi:putative transposase
MSKNTPSYHRQRSPRKIISHAVWLYLRFSLSFRDVQDFLAEWGITVSYEAIRQWCLRFGLEHARASNDATGGWVRRGMCTDCS